MNIMHNLINAVNCFILHLIHIYFFLIGLQLRHINVHMHRRNLTPYYTIIITKSITFTIVHDSNNPTRANRMYNRMHQGRPLRLIIFLCLTELCFHQVLFKVKMAFSGERNTVICPKQAGRGDIIIIVQLSLWATLLFTTTSKNEHNFTSSKLTIVIIRCYLTSKHQFR